MTTHLRPTFFRFLVFILSVFLAVPAAHAQGSDKVALRLYADASAAVPGQTLHLAIEQTIDDGWHTYWTNPGDSGQPMQITWNVPKGVTVSGLLWPAPEHVPYGPLMNFGYRDQAVVLTDLTVPANTKTGTMFKIRGQARVLVCDEICVPENHDIALDLPVAKTADDANADVFADAADAIPQPVDWATSTEYDANDVRVRITLPDDAQQFANDPESIEWFPVAGGYLDNASDQSADYDAATRVLTLRQARDDTRDMRRLNEAQYLLRIDDRAVIVGGPVAASAVPVMGGNKAADGDNLPMLVVLGFAFVGGLILNLMPCVFPVLSMKALHLASLPASERGRARLLGALYAAGVIVMFMALGGMLYSIRAAGDQLGWGFQLQNPAVVAGLAWLLFVIGLNLAGAFDLRVAFGGEVLLAEKHHPLLAAFLGGVLATAVATPCSAPFMATALGVALTQSMPVALGIFAMVGVGLAFPYVLLCLVPVLQKILPRPGAWMETFRQLLAFPMFASAVWLVWVVAQQGGPAAVGWALGGMVALALAVWLAVRQPQARGLRHVLVMAGLVLVVGTLASLGHMASREASATSAEPKKQTDIRVYNAEAFDHALNDTAQPVFVNMTASWCITCLVNERVVLDTDEIDALFKTLRVSVFKGDWTNNDASISSFLQRYGRTGVPLYVYFPAPDAATGKRPDPVVLPQILTRQIMFDTMK